MHQVDKPTFEYARERYPDIIGWAGPVVTKDGRPHFNATRLVTSRGTYVSVFSIKPVYYEALGGFWRPLSEVTTHHGNKTIRLKPDALRVMTPRYLRWLEARQRVLGSELVFDYGYMGAGVQPKHLMFATTSTFYPDPDPETTTMDGSVSSVFGTAGTTITTARNQTVGQAANASRTDMAEDNWGEVAMYRKAPSGNHHLTRGFVLFDSSSIPDSDTISSATFSLRGTGVTDGMNDAYGYIGLVGSTPASNTALVNDDYDQLDNTQLATGIDYTSFSTTGYNDFTLNATGIAAISKTGVTKFGVKNGHDIENQNWTGATAGSSCSVRSADFTGTTDDPKLVVEHSAAAAATFRPRVIMY